MFSASIRWISTCSASQTGRAAAAGEVLERGRQRAENKTVRRETNRDLILIGAEKTGQFVSHFEAIDQTSTGEERFRPGSYFLPTDEYIKKRIVFSDSDRQYGLATYFGRKFFYKTRNGARIVANIPFLSAEQSNIKTSDISLYPEFGTVCALLDRLYSSRYPNSLSPLILAHAQAAIPQAVGTKVLEQLAKELMNDG